MHFIMRNSVIFSNMAASVKILVIREINLIAGGL